MCLIWYPEYLDESFDFKLHDFLAEVKPVGILSVQIYKKCTHGVYFARFFIVTTAHMDCGGVTGAPNTSSI